MKEAGGYSIEIHAINTAIKFWHEKMKFKFTKKKGKHAFTIKKIKLKDALYKGVKDELYTLLNIQPMRRIRSDKSNDITPILFEKEVVTPNELDISDIFGPTVSNSSKSSRIKTRKIELI
jgi:hypothetical protein